jgi:hypothetical protein
MTYLAQERHDVLTPQAADCLDKIDTSSNFLLGLVNDVLDMAKAESGKIELHPEPYPPREFAATWTPWSGPCAGRSTRPSCFEPARAGLVPLARQAAHQPDRSSTCSPTPSNTPRRAAPSSAASRALPGGRPHHPAHRGRDNGIGMSEEFQKVLFEPFTQEGRSDVSEQRGSGLGLAITKRLVDLMGGTISVESAVGEGTTFFLDARTACPAERARSRTARASGGRTPSRAGASCCARIIRSTRRSPGRCWRKRALRHPAEDGQAGRGALPPRLRRRAISTPS